MKVLILSVADKRHMSMIAPYEEFFNDNNINYDIIRMNRYNEKKNIINKRKDGIDYEYSIYQSTNNSKIKKIIPFLKFKKYVRKIVKKNKYDFFVIWNENTAVLFADLLLKYRKNYCVNVRDIFEIPILRPIFDIVIKNSYFTTRPTPADAFGNQNSYITLYNRDTKITENVEKKKGLKKADEVLIVTFMGLYASAPCTFKKTVDVFGNDRRYELRFYGDGFDTELEKYVEKKKYKNIITGGSFQYEKTFQYLKETDIINSYYNNFTTSPNLQYCAGVKQSYTPMLYLPAINDEKTTWGSICKQYKFSYLINDKNIDTLPDDLFQWYHNLEFEKFKEQCDKFNEVVNESRNYVFHLLELKLKGNKKTYER